MEKIKIKDVVAAVKGEVVSGYIDEKHIASVEIDSRSSMIDGLFIAIKGEKTDGHKYVKDAISNGAIAILISEEPKEYLDDAVYIKVADTIKGLQDLASWYRLKFNIPIIAITGSVGKTTTKDMIYTVLNTQYKVHKTEGNLNSEIGAPLTILNINHTHEIAVIEMGMDHLGQIAKISKIIKPDMAVITNIGVAHIEYLKTRENILKAKCEVFENLSKSGVAILNADDDMLIKINNSFEKIWYGTGNYAKIKADNIFVDYKKGLVVADLHINEKKYILYIPGLSRHLVYSAMAAIAIGLKCNMSIDKVLKGIENYKHTKMRMDIYRLENDILLIDDTYNANPDSMKSLINTVKEADKHYKILILGDMFELGENTINLHVDVLQYAIKSGINQIHVVGDIMKEASNIINSSSIRHYESKDLLLANIKNIVLKDSIVAIKASRGMKFENIITQILANNIVL